MSMLSSNIIKVLLSF